MGQVRGSRRHFIIDSKSSLVFLMASCVFGFDNFLLRYSLTAVRMSSPTLVFSNFARALNVLRFGSSNLIETTQSLLAIFSPVFKEVAIF